VFDNDTVSEAHHHLSDSVERIHGPVNNGEFLGNKWPPLAKGLFKLRQYGMIKVTAGQGLATDPSQSGAQIGEK
jgi:hypothetical protein